MMPISIEVISYKGQPVTSPIAAVMQSNELSIGRLDSNQLVLPDNEKFVSSHHATMSSDGDRVFVTDCSTNGLFVNQASQPLGNNRRTELSHGDVLKMGEFELKVSITPDDIHSGLSPNTDPTDIDDPFENAAPDIVQQAIDNNQVSDFDPDDPFADFSQADKKPFTQGDNVSPLDEAFNQPQPSSTADQTPLPPDAGESAADPFSGIPENWMQDEKASSQAEHPIPSAENQAPASVEETATAQMKMPLTLSDPETSLSDNEIIQHFLIGTGLSPSDLGFELDSQSFESIGKLFKLVIQGLIDVMASRSEIKNEFRLDVTTLRSVENNPVKFSLNAEEAMIRLLAPNKPGYMTAEDAIEESFDDLRAHQVAVLSGMQSSLTDVLHLFNPEKLEQRLQKHNPIIANIPIQKRAKLWDLFEELYEEIETEAADNFNDLFGSSFAEAYEEQAQQFRKKKDKYPG